MYIYIDETYPAACKVEYQLFYQSNSQLKYFDNFIEPKTISSLS